ncbi:preprotein translocase subunit SecG [Nesterenkonia salmonea]|uniref:Protein-export membrane protein SecG n=3 Tax=Micrococcaceae TaxID=1268 RepID=A0A3A4FGD2_9MICC|nr:MULTISPECIES: preprotein translocase subunit SecG [Nesterenkonia]NDK30373.1 preprotein translocase subunit SecG [Nesterenkonia haasae]RJN31355.1 preprotein translocase subunit SecG [Nesterenkonia natronophila]TLP98844.1 preprotein translocase subunit SecG [Nesterenkonia salmonea]
MTAMTIGLQVALLVISLLLILLILLHKGRGGGMSDMFGGGITSSLGSSGVAERNLTRLTIVLGIVWGLIIVTLALLIQTTGSW